MYSVVVEAKKTGKFRAVEEFLRRLLGEHITLAWLVLIIGFCWIAYIPGRRQPNR
jgi:hypothetical protein